MRVRMDERHRNIAKTAVWTFSICVLIAIAIWRWSLLMGVLGKILSVLAPIILGLIMAYLLNPMATWLERKIGQLIERKNPHPKIKRALSVLLTMLILLASIFGLVASIVPEIFSSLKDLLAQSPEYLKSMTQWINDRIAGLKEEQPQIYEVVISTMNAAQSGVTNFVTQFEPKLDSIASGGVDFLTKLTSSAMSVFHWVTNIFIGLIITIYLLFNKENYLAQARKFLYATLQEEHVHNFLRIGSHVSYTFMHFLSGKSLDSLIIGLLCFIGMTILGCPYTALISIIIGVTNIIPFFGPIIGAVPTALLILLSEPKKVIPFVIFILILQQFDGNFLGPKILGDTLGLPMFWILFAITVGGGLFGFVGMVAFVPLFAAVCTLFTDFLEDRLLKKGLPTDTESYMTNEIHFAEKPASQGTSADATAAPADAETTEDTTESEEVQNENDS